MKIQIYLLIITVLFSLNVKSQWSYGIKAGVTSSFAHEKYDPPVGNSTAKYGFQAGGFVNRKISKYFSLQSGLQITKKGFKKEEGTIDGPFYFYRNVSLGYLELPLEVLLQIPFNRKAGIFFGGGPVAGWGVFGNYKSKVFATDGVGDLHDFSNNAHHPFSGNSIQSFDLGAEVLAGVRVGRMRVQTSYNHGLLNTRQTEKDLQSLKNRSFALTLGFELQSNRRM